jgi:hypothetical protein
MKHFGLNFELVHTHKRQTELAIPLYNEQLVGHAYQGKDIVFSFIIEYISLRDFVPEVIYSMVHFYMKIFER